MFYYVDGTVSVLRQGLAVIDCGGVGYACHASQNTISKLKVGAKARLLTYLNVREGIFELYGFVDEEEKSCFEMMIGVSGVGPKAALSILSVAPPVWRCPSSPATKRCSRRRPASERRLRSASFLNCGTK